MELGDYLSKYRKEAGLTIDELVSLSGVPKGTINKIIAGTTKSPTLETVQSLAAALGKSINDFTASPNSEGLTVDEQAHIKKYRLLDPYGKEAVDGVLDVESRRCEEARAAALRRERRQMESGEMLEPETVCFMVPWFFQPMGAGPGEEAATEPPEDLRLIKAPPRGTSFVAPVHGDSMEPTYHNGDLVFVHSTEEIPVGCIGAFFMDGQQWIKELGDGLLISHNAKYGPISMREDVKCQGLVLGVCDESYFE